MSPRGYLIKAALGGSVIQAWMHRPFARETVPPVWSVEKQRTLDNIVRSLPPGRSKAPLRAGLARLLIRGRFG